MRAPLPLEKEIQEATLAHWRTLGRPMTLVACLPNAGAMGQPGLTCGLPDLLVMGPDIPGPFPIAFLELKRRRPGKDGGNTRSRTPTEEAQANFAVLCAKLGIICTTAYGRDEPIAFLERWNVVRQQRYPEAPESRRLELRWP